MQFFLAIDGFLIECIFYPVAESWTRRTNTSNFMLAALCMFGNAVLGVFADLLLLRHSVDLVMIGLVTFFVSSQCIIGIFMIWVYARDERITQNKATANPHRILDLMGIARLVLLVLTIRGTYTDLSQYYEGRDWWWLVSLSSEWFFLSSIYFAAASPGPRKPFKAGNKLAVSRIG